MLDEKMRKLHDLIEEIRGSSIPVLLLGETGCGKEVVAEQIHARSSRSGRVFLRINCAGLSESVVESELFGHERGSFTGALAAHRGVFESAHGGTLMLDEVAELPLRTQAKLLRVLESGEFSRLGSCESRRVDVRIIAATHRGLHELMERGEFRRDLYYRLAGAELHIPPLRERRHEVLALAKYFLQRSGPAGATARLDAAAEVALLGHDWPGNVRELRNVIEYAVARCSDGVIRADLIELRRGRAVSAGSRVPHELLTKAPAVDATQHPQEVQRPPGTQPPPEVQRPPGTQPPPEAQAPHGMLPPLGEQNGQRAPSTSANHPTLRPSLRLRPQLERFERECIDAALARCGQNQTRAARELGISRRTLTEKLTKYGFDRPRPRRLARAERNGSQQPSSSRGAHGAPIPSSASSADLAASLGAGVDPCP